MSAVEWKIDLATVIVTYAIIGVGLESSCTKIASFNADASCEASATRPLLDIGIRVLHIPSPSWEFLALAEYLC